MCIGLHLAFYQLVTAVSHLAAHYQIESASAAAVRPIPHAILIPEGLRARITPLAGAVPAAGTGPLAAASAGVPA